MTTYHLSIVTPQGKIFDNEITSLSAPGSHGSLGVWARHTPLVASLKKGIIKVNKDNNDIYYVIGSGILEINQQHHCLILSDTAHLAENQTEAENKLHAPG